MFFWGFFFDDDDEELAVQIRGLDTRQLVARYKTYSVERARLKLHKAAQVAPVHART